MTPLRIYGEWAQVRGLGFGWGQGLGCHRQAGGPDLNLYTIVSGKTLGRVTISVSCRVCLHRLLWFLGFLRAFSKPRNNSLPVPLKKYRQHHSSVAAKSEKLRPASSAPPSCRPIVFQESPTRSTHERHPAAI